MEETEKEEKAKETEAAEKPENEAAEKSVKPETTGEQEGSPDGNRDESPDGNRDKSPDGNRDKSPDGNRDEKRLEAAIEAILFTTGKAVPSSDIAKALGIEKEEAVRLINVLMLRCEEENRGVRIARLEDAYQMCTKPEYYDTLIKLELEPKKPGLTDVMLETLSVIAYKQPVTKPEIERIRGVNSDHAVNRLVEYNLVRELGRAKLPGRPILFGTTEEFLREFGVSSKEDLPEISPVKLEDFKAEAENEARMNVDV